MRPQCKLRLSTKILGYSTIWLPTETFRVNCLGIRQNHNKSVCNSAHSKFPDKVLRCCGVAAHQTTYLISNGLLIALTLHPYGNYTNLQNCRGPLQGINAGTHNATVTLLRDYIIHVKKIQHQVVHREAGLCTVEKSVSFIWCILQILQHFVKSKTFK